MIARLPLIGVTLRGVLGRRRTWLMILLASLPVVVALIIRAGGGHANALTILDTLLIRTVMPLLALVLGTAVLGSELEDGTAVYLMIKPISRWRILLAKMAVAAGLTVALVFPATVATSLLTGRPERTVHVRDAGLRAGRVGGRRGVRVRVRDPQRVHGTRPHPGPVLRAHLGGRPVGLAGGHPVPVHPPGQPGPDGSRDGRHRQRRRRWTPPPPPRCSSWSWWGPSSSAATGYPASRSAAAIDARSAVGRIGDDASG